MLENYDFSERTHIYSGNKSIAKDANDRLLGRAVIFVTNSRDIEESELADYYAKHVGKDNKVRMIILDPKGYHVSDFLDFSFKNFGINDSNIKTFVGTLGSKTTAARMYTAFWNYRYSLIKIRNQYDDFVKAYGDDATLFQNGNVTAAGVNKFNDEILYKESEHRLSMMPVDGISSPAGSLTTYTVKDQKRNGVQVNYDQIVVGIETIDAIFEHVLDKIIKLVDPVSKNTVMKLDIVTNAISNYNEGGIGLNADVVTEDGVPSIVTITNKAFTGGGAFKVINALSTMYKMLNSKGYRSINNMVLSTKDTFGNPVDINMLDASSAIREVANSRLGRIANGSSKTRSLFNSIVNMVLEGNPDPIANATKTGENRRGFAPFKYGVFSQARYASRSTEKVMDFYPATNTFETDQYDFNVVPEDPMFEITIPNGVYKNEARSEPEDNLESIKQYNIVINNAVTMIKSETDIDISADQIPSYNKSLSYEDNLNSIAGNIRYIINEQIALGKLTKTNGDRVLSVTIDYRGIIKDMTTLYTSPAIVNSSIVPKDEDNNVDTSKIANITYESGNNNNFIITLKDGNSIKGTIQGNNVEVFPQTTYSLSLLTNSKTEGILEKLIGYIKDLGVESNSLMQYLNNLIPFISDNPDSKGLDMSLEERRVLANTAKKYLNALNEANLFGTSEKLLLDGMLNEDGTLKEEFSGTETLLHVLKQLTTLQNIEQDQCKITLF